jgi:HYR domain
VLFPVGKTTVNYSAADSRGNKTTGSFTVTVVAPAA